jgi:hypothetical protein
VKEEENADIHRYEWKVGKNPYEVIAMEPSWIRESLQDFVDYAVSPRQKLATKMSSYCFQLCSRFAK